MSSAAAKDSRRPLAARIKVAVRLRPIANKENKACVHGPDDSSLEIWNWRDTRQTIKYKFDAFFDSSSRQQDVYEKCVKPLAGKILSGQNTSIFAYGPTGAGKTHTMLGTGENPGIIPRTVNSIFNLIENKENSDKDWLYSLSFSYLEIYQEKVFDLLEVKDHDLAIREDRDRTIFIPNLAEKTVTSLQQFHELFVPASKNRTTAATKLNSRSSRSHSLLMLKVIKKRRVSPFTKQIGKAYLIDLAGSENNKKTGNQGIRLKESGAINTSLFVLGQVVDALNQGLGRIPYRDSKLTRLLQDSLGGSAHACMITNIAPEESSYMETYTALNFASKSRLVVNRPFTKESTERSPVRAPLKRVSNDNARNTAACSQPKRTRNGSTGCQKAQGEMLFLSPLLRRQANFEENMRKRLQSLEADIMTRLDSSSNQGQAKTSHDQQNDQILQQLRESSRQLSELQKDRSILFHHTTTNVDQSAALGSHSNSPGTLPTYRPDVRPKVRPRAAVRPLNVMSPPVPVSPANTVQKPTKTSGSTPAVQFLKTSKIVRPSSGAMPGDEENSPQQLLQPNPELRAKHAAGIIHLLNTGTVRQLKALQSVGEKRARLIYDWRQMFGQFTTIDELKNVNGLPAKTVTAIIKNNLLCVGTD